jgi:hypothetical protein
MTARSLPPSKFRLSLFAVSLRPLLALSSAIFAFFVQLSKIQCGRAAEPVASDFSLSRPVWNVFVFPLTKIFASFLINILEKAKAVWTSDKVETSGFDRFILRARPSFRGANEARKSSSHKCQVVCGHWFMSNTRISLGSVKVKFVWLYTLDTANRWSSQKYIVIHEGDVDMESLSSEHKASREAGRVSCVLDGRSQNQLVGLWEIHKTRFKIDNQKAGEMER